MEEGFFITGTDTGVGKTLVSAALMHYFKKQGKSVAAMKPVASGAIWKNSQLVNDDALLLQQSASEKLQYESVNPYVFEEPVSPHIAAKNDGKIICFDKILKNLNQLQQSFDIVIVEGVGGWLVPLGPKIDISDLAKTLKLPVIVVVAIRLGCINHARLTFAAINKAGVTVAGWVANCVDPGMAAQQENIQTIKELIAAPLLSIFPYFPEPDLDELAGLFPEASQFEFS